MNKARKSQQFVHKITPKGEQKMTSLGERIKKIRGKMTQKEFSELLGITQRAVINYEISGRVPRKKILKAICEQFKICEHWLLTGEGPMHQEQKEPETTSDMSEVLRGGVEWQPIENIDLEKETTSDMSENLRLRQKLELSLEKMVELQERLLSLTEQNADLRLQLAQRDTRIRELERENAGLREALKGAAAVQREAAGWQAG